MTAQFTGVDVYPGRWDNDPTPRWFVVASVSDGGEVVFDMQLSAEAAARSASETAKDLDVPLLHAIN